MSKTVWIINQYASTPEYGYAGRHYYFGQELSKRGYDVYLIASGSHHLLRKKPKLYSLFSEEQVNDKFKMIWCDQPSYSKAHSKTRLLGWFLFSWRIRKLEKIIPKRPDVILCSSLSLVSFLGAQSLARKYNARLVFEVRDIWPLTLIEVGKHSKYHPLVWLLQRIEDFAYKRSDAVISNLKNACTHMESRGLQPEKFHWIPNGFSLPEVQRNASLNAGAKRSLPADKFIVGYTGTLGVANALDTLILAAEILKAHTEIAFVMVGDGQEKAKLSKMIKDLGLANVHLVGSIPKIEIQAMLANFDACYIGLNKEPLFRFGVSPNKLYEYLYAKKPIIYGIESGDYKPVADAHAGIQIPAGSPCALADAVLALYQLPKQELEQMGQNGYHSALENYEYGKLTTQLEHVLFSNSAV